METDRHGEGKKDKTSMNLHEINPEGKQQTNMGASPAAQASCNLPAAGQASRSDDAHIPEGYLENEPFHIAMNNNSWSLQAVDGKGHEDPRRGS